MYKKVGVINACVLLHMDLLISEEMRKGVEERGRDSIAHGGEGEQLEKLHVNVGNRKITGFDVTRQCPLVLLEKVC
jgi:hypothetical protein